MPTPSKKMLTILFSISLTLNIFLGGLTGAHLWHFRSYDGPAENYKHSERKNQWHELSSEQRDLFKGIWREHKSDIRSNFKAMRAAHNRLKENLKGKTERSDFEIIFDTFAKEQSVVHTQTIKKLLDIAMTLPPEDRSAFLSLWGRGPGRSRPHQNGNRKP